MTWRTGTTDDYNKWTQQYQRSPNNPYTFWEDSYDQHIIPYLAKLKAYNQAMDKQKRHQKKKTTGR